MLFNISTILNRCYIDSVYGFTDLGQWVTNVHDALKNAYNNQ
jgi:hypothetical protein